VQQQLLGSVLEKADRSPVTVADFASQALICRTLQRAFPADAVVGEESAAELREEHNRALCDKVLAQIRPSFPEATPELVCSWIDLGGGAPRERFWTLDPIDGTKGFLRGEQYAVALGLIVGGQVVVAALGCPNLPVDFDRPHGPKGVVFSAVRGGGCTVAPLDGGGPAVPARVAADRDPKTARICESVESGHSSHDRSLASPWPRASPRRRCASTARRSTRRWRAAMPRSTGASPAATIASGSGTTPVAIWCAPKPADASPISRGATSTSVRGGGSSATAAWW
jgi:3'(2'), 5'-bisphosphate nucleotidase